MTREEREKALYALRKSAPIMAMTPNEFDDYIKTLNKIADWLEQEPCEDCISRQAVFDLCDTQDRYEIPYEYSDGGKHIKGYDEGRIINVTKLKMLPSVTPKP